MNSPATSIRARGIEEIVAATCKQHLRRYHLDNRSQMLILISQYPLLPLCFLLPFNFLWVCIWFVMAISTHAIFWIYGDAIAGVHQFARGDLLAQMEAKMSPLDLQKWRRYFANCTKRGSALTVGQLRNFAKAERVVRINREALLEQRLNTVKVEGL